MTSLPARPDLLIRGVHVLLRNAANRKGVKFHMRFWAVANSVGRYELNCGTTACAAGLFVLSDEFRPEGLCPFVNRHGELQARLQNDLHHVFDAVTNLLQLNYGDSNRLFSPRLGSPELEWQGAEGERQMAHRLYHYAKTGEILDSDKCQPDFKMRNLDPADRPRPRRKQKDPTHASSK